MVTLAIQKPDENATKKTVILLPIKIHKKKHKVSNVIFYDDIENVQRTK